MQKRIIIEKEYMESILSGLETHAKAVAVHNNWTEKHLEDYLLKYRSAFAIFFYTGLRCSEVLGDIGLKWKVLSNKGKELSNKRQLPKLWWKETEESGIWEWKSRPPTKGILKEDIELVKGTLYIYSKPLKGGRRDTPIELSRNLPYVQYIVKAWESTEAGERVFKLRHSALWATLHRLSGLSSHKFRKSRANWFASQPDVDLTGMLQWFGWARIATADSYVAPARGATKMRKILDRVVTSD